MLDTYSAAVDEDTPSPTAAGDPSPPAVLLGKYEIKELLGVGSSAKVYHATNVNTGQSVAIKAVCKQQVFREGLTVHVEREIAIMSRLHHPHTVKLFEVLASKSKIYFVLELAHGGELFHKVSQGRFSEDLSRRYFHQLISAVRYCHSAGVFHRDLKLENLLIDEDMNLKVSDFGLSALKDHVSTTDGLLHTVCGTPAYLAPEMLAKKGYDGAKVDVWSCGVILFVLTAGYLPFNDHSLATMYRKIYRGQFRFPRWTSPSLRRFLCRLLDKNPETRITVEEMTEDPWFCKGYRKAEVGVPREHRELEFGSDRATRPGKLNAFDLISFSSGFDMSGLFTESGVWEGVERIVSGEKAAKIMEKVEGVAKEEGVTVRRREGSEEGLRLEGQNGNLVIVVTIYRLTEKLVVVEAKTRERGTEGEDRGATTFWEHKLKPQLHQLVYQT